LPFGIEGVEGEGGLSGPTGAGQDNESIPWNDHIDILQVVLSGTLDADAGWLVGRHG
jgi:hypothetical protein